MDHLLQSLTKQETVIRLSDAGGNNSTYFCTNCSVSYDIENENVRRESKLSVPDRNEEPLLAQTPGRDYFKKSVGISPKGLFPPGAGIAMTNFNGALEALIAGKDGSIYVAWTGPKGWEGPVRIY